MPADTPIPVDLTAAREALARLDLPPCLARVPDEHPNDPCERPAGHDGPCRVTPDPIDKEHLRAALAEVDRLTAERDELAARVEQLSDRVTAAEGRLELAAAVAAVLGCSIWHAHRLIADDGTDGGDHAAALSIIETRGGGK